MFTESLKVCEHSAKFFANIKYAEMSFFSEIKDILQVHIYVQIHDII